MNKKRLKLGILFYFSSQWMGGIIYIINLIKILEFLEDDEKPEILLFYRPGLKKFVEEIQYPYLTAVEWTFPSISKGIVRSLLSRKNVFVDSIIKKYDVDAIFPMHDFPVRTKTKVKLVSWWADHQHKHYPEFFTRMQVFGRNLRTRLILRNCDDLVVSSQDVLDDFNRFFSVRKDMRVHIFHFVSVIDNMENLKIEELRSKYSLPEEYFMVSNQFHKHKNHRIVLLALARLKERGIKLHVAFTGKFPAAADSPYLAELHKIIDENNLHNQITMLGLISRADQLQIMRHAQAVIQPSLFEGWSTVIEDAKSLQVPVVASNLKVNIEQLGNEGVYFDPHNADELTAILSNYPKRNLNDTFYEDYTTRVKAAAKTLIAIFRS